MRRSKHMNTTKEGKQKATVNGLTPAQERGILMARDEALSGKNIVGPLSVEEFKKYIDSV